MKVKEVYVSITKAESIFEVIKQSLSVTKDIQIFVAEELIEELWRNGVEHHVYEFNRLGCHHYNKDNNGDIKKTRELYIFYVPTSLVEMKFCRKDETHQLCNNYGCPVYVISAKVTGRG